MAFNHMIDVAFEIVSDHEDWTQIPVDELIEAMESRARMLKLYKENALEAFSHCDVYEV